MNHSVRMISSGAYGIRFSSLKVKLMGKMWMREGGGGKKKKLTSSFKPILTGRLTGFARKLFLACVDQETSLVKIKFLQMASQL